MNLYRDKEEAYFTNIRYDLISLIPKQPGAKILEIGAGGGDTLVAIKEMKLAAEVVGVELNALERSNQRHPSIDKFIFANIETESLPLDTAHFDVIICGDILEHLLDPWVTISKIENFLKPGGVLLVSIPNFRHHSVFTKLFIKGNFDYTSYGLFDKTHLRFFCKKDMIKMFSLKNLNVVSAIPIFNLLPNSKIKTLNKLTFGLLEEFLSLQFILVVKKTE